MNPIKISVDVICKSDTSGFPPSYRVYLDNDLLTERTFTWNKGVFIKEHIVANLSSGVHTISVTPCKHLGEFLLSNITVNGKVTSGTQFTI